jgi:hypothetical protein
MTNPTKVNKTDKTEDQSGIEVDLADIPLPPPELDDELDNSHVAKGATASTQTGGKVSKPRPETARLEFVTEAETRVQTHDLEHPFHLDGEVIKTITINRLTISEVGDTVSAGIDDYYDIYAVMTGLPAPVLRGLMDVDGDSVVGKCRDFFPSFLLKENG